MNIITESLFYTGGTITTNDIIKTTSKLHNIAFNDHYMFIFTKENKLIKVVKIELQHEFTYKIMKTKVKIIKDSFIELLTGSTWNCVTPAIINNILTKTNAISKGCSK